MSDTDDVMEATYCALCRHGYADLTMADIAEECDRSKAALHYHYDTKRDLLVAFLDYLLARFEDDLAEIDTEDPVERLLALGDEALSEREEHDREFGTAVLELEAQAPYEEAFRERIAAFDEVLRERVADAVREGKSQGRIREDVDPDDVADFVLLLVDGAHTREVSVGEGREAAREALREYVEARLLTGGVAA